MMSSRMRPAGGFVGRWLCLVLIAGHVGWQAFAAARLRGANIENVRPTGLWDVYAAQGLGGQEAHRMGSTQELGERVLERRAALGMSQRELAGEEMSPSYVSLIEAGKRWPTLDILQVLAQRLRTTTSSLTSGAAPDERPFERVELGLRWAVIALRAGNPSSAHKHASEVIRADCSPEQRLEALSVMAAAAEAQGNLDEAIDILEPLLKEIDAESSRELWRSCQVMLCRCYKDAGDLAHAIDLGERALASVTDMNDQEVLLAISLSGAYYRRGDVKRAGRLIETILSRAEVAGSHANQGSALWNASLVAEAEGRLPDAIRLSERALALLGESDAVRNLGRLRVTYAYLLREGSSESVPLARKQLQRAQAEFELEGSVIETAQCLTELARCAIAQDDLVEAENLVERAIGVIIGGPESERANVELVRGHILVRRGQIAEGIHTAKTAALAFDQVANSPREAAQAWREVAALARSAGDDRLAIDALERAVDSFGIRPVLVGTSSDHTLELVAQQQSSTL